MYKISSPSELVNLYAAGQLDNEVAPIAFHSQTYRQPVQLIFPYHTFPIVGVVFRPEGNVSAVIFVTDQYHAGPVGGRGLGVGQLAVPLPMCAVRLQMASGEIKHLDTVVVLVADDYGRLVGACDASDVHVARGV